jgi:S-adenosylmethionine decarboxylase proenzyme
MNFELEPSLGKHIVVDMYDVNMENLSKINYDQNNKDEWNQFISSCFESANITLLQTSWNDFNSNGAFTALYLLAESHLSIHTWPEYKYVALDVFTCGNSNTQLVVNKLIEYFEPGKKNIVNLTRGSIFLNAMTSQISDHHYGIDFI